MSPRAASIVKRTRGSGTESTTSAGVSLGASPAIGGDPHDDVANADSTTTAADVARGLMSGLSISATL